MVNGKFSYDYIREGKKIVVQLIERERRVELVIIFFDIKNEIY